MNSPTLFAILLLIMMCTIGYGSVEDPGVCRVVDCSLPESKTFCPRKCSDADLCSNKVCGAQCDTSHGVLQVVRFCQPDGSCGSNSQPVCQVTQVVSDTASEDDKVTCGAKYKNRSRRVVGGTKARPGAWPWAVSLVVLNGGEFKHYCGGTLLNRNTVLTGALCVSDDPSLLSHVRLGVHDITSSEGVLHIRIAQAIKHPQFDSRSLANDIAIIKLEESVKYGRNIQPICLPVGYKDQDLTKILVNPDPTIVGWGKTEEGGYPVNILRQAEVPVVPLEECKRAYKYSTIDDTNMCAGRGVTDACQGDSGSPLMSTALGGAWSLVGISSWGIGCAREEFPGIYTRVDQYLDWIKKIM